MTPKILPLHFVALRDFMITIIRDPEYVLQKRAKIASKAVHRWNAIFESCKKYRDLNEVFVLQLIEVFESLTGTSLKHVVDLGCGTGDTLAKFCKQGFDVTGIDFSIVGLKKAKIALSSCNGRVTLIEADMEDLDKVKISVPAGTLWLCKLTLAFIKDKTSFLRSVRNKMNSGDMFLLITPVLHNDIIYQRDDKSGIAILLEEVDSLVLGIFGNSQIFSNEYHGERGHTISYLIERRE